MKQRLRENFVSVIACIIAFCVLFDQAYASDEAFCRLDDEEYVVIIAVLFRTGQDASVHNKKEDGFLPDPTLEHRIALTGIPSSFI
jgi:hypothetical protein